MTIADPLRDIFGPEVLARLRSISHPSDGLLLRLEVLRASGPLPISSSGRQRVRWLRAKKAAWEVYIEAAFRTGLLSGEREADVRARLTGIDDNDFRSALAECMACWVLAGRLRLATSPAPLKSSGRLPDLLLRTDSGNITVEVKAPCLTAPDETDWPGNNSAILAKSADEANRQFLPGEQNVLFLVIDTDHPLVGRRGDLVRAFLGEEAFEITLNRETGKTISTQTRFWPRGKFLKRWDKGIPRFTRIGAVVCARELLVRHGSDQDDQQIWIEPHWVVLHNPFCPVRIATTLWGGCAQLVLDDNVLRWTDGGPICEF